MNNEIKPTYAIHVWWSGSETLFSVIENMTINQAKEFYDYHKLFNGKTAVVFVFFSDYDLRDEDLLQAATRFMKGDYIRYDIDLYWGNVTKSKGVDRTNPRQ